jgi:ABC-type polysaccharide/polyol phosphate export permease
MYNIGMYRTLRLWVKDMLRYFRVAVLVGWYRFRDTGEGRVMGVFWEFGKPLVYAVAIGTAISVGFRSAKGTEDVLPYLVWLFAGFFAWNFMAAMLGQGGRLFLTHRKLVIQGVVPVTMLPLVFMVKRTFIFSIFICGTCALGVLAGVGPFVTWIQVPFILAAMVAYWYLFVILVASLGTLSRDFAMFVSVLTTPLFWGSGILFDVSGIESHAFQTFLLVNPISFFAIAFRAAVHDGEWVIADTRRCAVFGAVFLVTAVLAVVVYHLARLEIRNELREAGK